MNISFSARAGYEIYVIADNVNLSVDIESRKYEIGADGKTDYSRCKRDISDEAMERISVLLSDMALFRKDEFDSSSLIEELFAKLPKDAAFKLCDKMFQEYGNPF
jgi:hypothetical protein